MIHGGDRGDLAFATGFVHAQDRFFQMDLLRRAGAGELAALFGKALLPVDRERRIHRFGARAGVAAGQPCPTATACCSSAMPRASTPASPRSAARPFEYGVLRATPRPWVRAGHRCWSCGRCTSTCRRSQLHRVFSRGWLRDQGTDAEQLAFLLPTASG